MHRLFIWETWTDPREPPAPSSLLGRALRRSVAQVDALSRMGIERFLPWALASPPLAHLLHLLSRSAWFRQRALNAGPLQSNCKQNSAWLLASQAQRSRSSFGISQQAHSRRQVLQP